jgi:hypothetical protein
MFCLQRRRRDLIVAWGNAPWSRVDSPRAESPSYSEIGGGAGFQPLYSVLPKNMGRCPMLEWIRAVGPLLKRTISLTQCHSGQNLMSVSRPIGWPQTKEVRVVFNALGLSPKA